MSNTTVDRGVRVGDRERERAVDTLGQAMAQGYLTLDEYDQRIGTVYTADTVRDLEGVLADLPLGRILRQDPRRRDRRRQVARRSVAWHALGYATMVTVCLVVWLSVGLTAGAWYFWPVWPMLGGAVAVASHALPIRLCSR